MNEKSTDVLVIGGGITGVATLYELAKRGTRATLLERDDLHAMASGWTLSGVRQSGRDVAELPLAVAAINRWATLADELDSDLHYRREGNLRLALAEEEADTITEVIEQGRTAGLPISWLNGADALREHANCLHESITGASFCETDGHADNIATVRAYASAAENLGASIVTGVHVQALVVDNERVVGVETNAGRFHADHVVLATGIYTPHLLKPLGLHLPIEVVLCPVIETVPAPEVTLKPVLGVAKGSFAARQTTDGRIRFIGASDAWTLGDHTTDNHGPTVGQLEATISNAIKVMPGLQDLRMSRVWGGLIDRTPDTLPVIERNPRYDGLVIGAGYSGHGFGIGPISGEILANLVLDGDDSRFDLTPFALERFAKGDYETEALRMNG